MTTPLNCRPSGDSARRNTPFCAVAGSWRTRESCAREIAANLNGCGDCDGTVNVPRHPEELESSAMTTRSAPWPGTRATPSQRPEACDARELVAAEDAKSAADRKKDRPGTLMVSY